MIELDDIYGTDPRQAMINAFLYHLMAERLKEGDTNIAHIRVPTWEQHMDFIRRQSYLGWYAIRPETRPAAWVGAVSIDTKRDLGIVISHNHRRKGYARQALLAIMKKHAGPYTATIRDGNQASVLLFQSLGFAPYTHTFKL